MINVLSLALRHSRPASRHSRLWEEPSWRRREGRAGRFELAAVFIKRHASTIGAACNPDFDIVRQITAFDFNPKVVTGSLSSSNIEGRRLTSVDLEEPTR